MLNAAASEKNDFAKGDGVRVQSVGKKHPLYKFWHVLIC